MASCAVLVPVLGRPHRVEPLVRSLEESGADARLVFLCSPGDDGQIEEVRRHAGFGPGARHAFTVVPWDAGPGDWAKKINLGFAGTLDEWKLLGADDVAFEPGWLAEAMRVYAQTNACVIGTNDQRNRDVMRGLFSTHPLVHRDYLDCGTVDEPGKIVHEGYDHNFPDRELAETAKARGTWAFARSCVVRHDHPNWKAAEVDATYEKGMRLFHKDARLFGQRRRLWR